MASRAKDKVRRLSAHDHFAGSPLALHVKWNDVNRMVAPHSHEFLEIAVITRGSGEHISSRRRVLTTAGDVWIVRPGYWHTYMNVKHLGVYNCLLGLGLFKTLTPALQQDPNAVELFWRLPFAQARDGCCLLRLNPQDRIAAERALDGLCDALKVGEPHGVLEARGRLWLFIGVLSRAHARARQTQGAAPATTRKEPERHPVAAEAVEFLENRYAMDLTVTDLAREVGMSPPHLARVFRTMTGLSPMRYLACVRAQRACVLLGESERSMTEIAGDVGWPDPNLFARRFRQIMGVSPSAYRQKHQGQRHAETKAAEAPR
ncbi:MAG: helix-turn-helix domain-containing protein [Planctomycetota bacterium]|nr:helix-turn-helix domain-containing protein [Planctomycetota bacterium]